MARPKKTLAKWMDEATSDNMQDTAIKQFSLVHMKGQVPLEIYKYDKFATEFDAKKVAELFEDKAHTHVQNLEGQGPQTFNVLAFYGKEKPGAYFIFMVHPGASDQDGYLSTEAPNAQGEKQQEMRWREMDRGLVYRQQTALNHFSLQVIEQQGRMINQLQGERFENGNMVMQMISQMHDKTHAHEMEKINSQRNAELMSAGMKLLPAVANTVMGRDVFPQSTEDTAIIDGLVDGMMKSSTDPGDMMQKLGMMLQMVGIPEAMMGIISQRVIKGIEKRQREAEAQAKARNVGLTKVSKKDAEQDLNGSGE